MADTPETPRRRGRPPLEAGTEPVDMHVRLPQPQYRELMAQAQREGVSWQTIMRRALQRAINRKAGR